MIHSLKKFFDKLIDIGMKITHYSVILKICEFYTFSHIV
jgi:hypothetical protein